MHHTGVLLPTLVPGGRSAMRLRMVTPPGAGEHTGGQNDGAEAFELCSDYLQSKQHMIYFQPVRSACACRTRAVVQVMACGLHWNYWPVVFLHVSACARARVRAIVCNGLGTAQSTSCVRTSPSS